MSIRKSSRLFAALGLAVTALPGLVLLLGSLGCGHKEDPPPAGSTYYTGPMKPKGSPGGGAGAGKAPQ